MSAAETVTANFTVSAHPAFFAGEASVGSGVYYLQFPNANLFGYYNFVASSIFYHYDLGYEAFVPGSAADLYMYDFTLNAWLYYFPGTKNPGHYTTNPRYFVNLTSGKIFTM